MSITRAQASALSDGFLDSLGSEKTDNELPIIDAMLSAAAKDFIDTASANLDRANAVSSGDLSSELTFDTEQSGSMYTLSVGYPKGSKAEGYYDYNNKGVQGVNKAGRGGKSPYKFRTLNVSKRHVASIEGWLKRSGASVANISPAHPASGLERKNVDLDPLRAKAIAIAKRAKIDGLAPTHYFDDAVKTSFGASFNQALAVALGGEVRLRIRQLAKELKK